MDLQGYENRSSVKHSWVSIVNGVGKYVTESMLTTKEEDIASVKPIAKAGLRQKPTITLTSVSIPVLERKWIDIETHASMITGISMGQETCRILGQVSLTLLYWKNNLLTDIRGPGRD